MNHLNDHHPEVAVKNRYNAAAKAPEAMRCCPMDYDRRYLEIIQQEVIEKDCGCGDPSRYLKPAGVKPFACGPTRLRHPHETKGMEYKATSASRQCCDGGCC
ncbi:MAG TPA: hypothetical protein VGW37_11725 [Terriglobia bacterium]|nr:hypothetical protein [Terriglobia bacterium]